jgi:hypothetical protein
MVIYNLKLLGSTMPAWTDAMMPVTFFVASDNNINYGNYSTGNFLVIP